MSEDLRMVQWVAERAKGHNRVVDVQILSPSVILVMRDQNQVPAKVSVMSIKGAVSTEHLQNALGIEEDVDFVLNVPRVGYFNADAMTYAREGGFAIGGLADLYRALNEDVVSEYLPKELQFIERALNHHDCVEDFTQEADWLFTINRTGGRDSLLILFLYEYELTAEHVRTARTRYGAFDAIVKTNPNGSITLAAEEVANDLGCILYTWTEFLRALRQR